MAGFAAEHEIQDGPLTFKEACAHVSGQKLQGPEAHPMKSDRAPGDVQISDLPIRRLEPTSAKVEQFADMRYHPLNRYGKAPRFLQGRTVDTFKPGVFDDGLLQ